MEAVRFKLDFYPLLFRPVADNSLPQLQPTECTRQSQNLVGFAQFSNFALQHFYPVALGPGNAIAHANIDLVFTDPIMQGLGNTTDLGAQWIQRLPTRTDTRHGVRTPCGPHVHVLRGKTCLISSWLHSLRCGSLHKTRGGSVSQLAPYGNRRPANLLKLAYNMCWPRLLLRIG